MNTMVHTGDGTLRSSDGAARAQTRGWRSPRGFALRAADLLLAAGAAATGLAIVLARHARRGRPPVTSPARLLHIDSMYSLKVLRARRHEHLVTRRDLDGYLEHVWSVHPFVGADPTPPPTSGVGSPTVTPLTPAHTMIEGKVARHRWLMRLPRLNFALAQAQLVLALDRLVQRERIAIVRGDAHYGGVLALLLGRLNGRPVEVRINGNFDAIYESVGTLAYPRLFRWRAVERRVVRCALSRADSVVVFNADNASFALRNGATADRLKMLENASMVNPIHHTEPRERDAPDDEFGLGDRPIVVLVSRLERLKHPEDVVLAVAKARRRDGRIAGIIVGDGTMRREMAELCCELGVQDDIVFAGDRDQRWIAGMLTRADVVAAPLAGLALVEAALSGTAIVAYDIEWHAELLRADREGVLVTYRDTDAMADAICALIADPETAARLASAARARALELVDPAERVAEERALVDGLLALSSSR
jgi:glycosyltransferase involved in cell wall biosynthesis